MTFVIPVCTSYALLTKPVFSRDCWILAKFFFCAFWTETKIKDLSYGQKETFFSFLAHSGSQSDHRSRSIFSHIIKGFII